MKKFISICLVIAVTLALIPSALAVYSASDPKAPDQTMLDVLKELDILPAGYNTGAAQITRGDFARLLINTSTKKSLGEARTRTSPFSDVPYTYPYAQYVKLCVQSGYMNGYNNGTFLPYKPILLEEATVSILRMLGYTSAQYGSAYPSEPVGFARKLGLFDHVSVKQGAEVGGLDMCRLLYNALVSDDGVKGTPYVTQLGYSIKEDYLKVTDISGDDTKGPFVASDLGWYASTGLRTDSVTVYRDDNVSSLSMIAQNDIYYYSVSENEVWVYSSKIAGILQAVSPSRASPTAITVSGVTYQLDGDDVEDALSSGSKFDIGSTVVVLLGKNGAAAAVMSPSDLSNQMYGYVTGTGNKYFTNPDGSGYTSNYISVILTSGLTAEYPVSNTDLKSLENSVVLMDFRNNKITVTLTPSVSVSGTVNSVDGVIGQHKMSPQIEILNINTNNNTCFAVSKQRLDKSSLQSDNVRFYALNASGEIYALVVRNLMNNDANTFAMVLDITENRIPVTTQGGLTTESISSSYTFLVGAEQKSYSFQNMILGIKKQPVMITMKNASTVDKVENLTLLQKSQSLTVTGAVTENGRIFPFADNVLIYRETGTNKYSLMTLSQLLTEQYSSFEAYYDKTVESGGRVRVVIVK